MALGLSSVVAVATGILGSAWWAGNTASISMFTVPVILDACKEPQQALKLWEALYNRGKATGPRVSLVILLAYGYSAYDSRSRGLEWTPYLLSGALTIAIIPWTLGLMMPTNNALLAGASGVGKAMAWEEARVLLNRWAALNFARGLLPLAGASVGIWHVMKNWTPTA